MSHCCESILSYGVASSAGVSTDQLYFRYSPSDLLVHLCLNDNVRLGMVNIAINILAEIWLDASLIMLSKF